MKTNRLGHKIIRAIGQFNLCVDESAGYPTHYIENSILTKYTKGKGISYNFDDEKAAELMRISDNDFIQRAKQAAGNDIDCEEVVENMNQLV